MQCFESEALGCFVRGTGLLQAVAGAWVVCCSVRAVALGLWLNGGMTEWRDKGVFQPPPPPGLSLRSQILFVRDSP